ncbi:unnamed protein product [Microthlaspi erraticum]|uniref:C2H2-type domain-containing protein n=1 Tax=Microthlaspi erraticum TaxID=1685480 RepID=A0A6D2L415_9BRAS|nr:unnamed protein product [Microthlaspi erraticum]
MNSETLVWWDMDSCPVPASYDASLVGPSIHLALEKLGYRGPVTITAVGKLKHTSEDVLRAISSTGITVKYDPLSRYDSFSDEVESWQLRNPAPASIMLIADSSLFDLWSRDLRSLQKERYNTLLVYRSAPPKKAPKLVTSAKWRWKSLLKEAMASDGKLEAKRQILQEKRSKRSFVCTLCYAAWRSVEKFAGHLQCLDHEVKKFETAIDTDCLDNLDQEMMEKELEELECFLKEEAKLYRRTKVTTKLVKRASILLAKKIQWEELKKKLKERDQLASQGKHERWKEFEGMKKRKFVNEGAESSRQKKMRLG